MPIYNFIHYILDHCYSVGIITKKKKKNRERHSDGKTLRVGKTQKVSFTQSTKLTVYTQNEDLTVSSILILKRGTVIASFIALTEKLMRRRYLFLYTYINKKNHFSWKSGVHEGVPEHARQKSRRRYRRNCRISLQLHTRRAGDRK